MGSVVYFAYDKEKDIRCRILLFCFVVGFLEFFLFFSFSFLLFSLDGHLAAKLGSFGIYKLQCRSLLAFLPCRDGVYIAYTNVSTYLHFHAIYIPNICS